MAQEPVNILLVDDQPANLLALEAVLEDPGCRLVKATSGEDALRSLLDRDFAAVLLDVRMAGLNGIETARLIRGRERSHHTPILFLTAHDDRPAMDEAYSLGAVDYLVKPVSPVVLRAKVAVFVELFRKTEQVHRQAEQLRRIERHEFERKLADENARFRALTEHSSDAVILVRADGTVIYGSPSIRRVLGYDPEAFVGRNGFEIIHPDDHAGARSQLAELAGSSGAPVTAEMRALHRDGSWRWVECVATNLLREPAVGAVVVNFRDITERRRATDALRESEERFRRLIEADIVGVGISDGGGAWLEANDEVLRITGFSREELRAGRARWIEQTPAPYLPLDEARIAEARSRGACTPYEKEYVRKDGSLVPVLIGFAALEEAGDRFICFVLDLTAQKRVEAALKEADRRKDEFLAMLAHELRNPLAPIGNAAHVLRVHVPSDPDLLRATDMIERQVQHLARLVDDLLDASRFTQGKVKLQTAPVDLTAVVARAVETCQPLVEARRHELTVALPPESIWVDGDATRLSQVVGNLLNNAVKYTAEGGRVRLSVERDRGEAVVRVADDGVGIPADLLPRVFDLFVQGDRSPARSEGGLGIGLTLVRSLAELHGGRAEARSDGPGKGSEFTVRLPVRPEGGAPPGEGGETAGAGPVPPRRVLIVDDNADAAEMLAMFLRTEGHEVRTAHDGPAALQSAESFRPEVVFLDIGLPRMDGYEVARRLRREVGLKTVRLVALTGYGQEEDRRKASEAGFDAHLVKPANPTDLQQMLADSAPAKESVTPQA